MIHVAWPDWEARTSWDQNIVLELTAGDDYQHGKAVPLGEGAVVVIPGQHHVLHAAPLAEQIARLPWALTIVTSDEEALFPVELLPHDDKHAIWGQYHARSEFDRVIPIGAQPGTDQILAQIEATHPARMGDVFFAGQGTHSRRHELLDVMKEMACNPRYGNVTWLGTTGFRQGLDQEHYLRGLRDARIAPCPSGPHSLDSFRLYEAFAAGCLPVVEGRTPHGDEAGFWRALFGDDCPIPMVWTWRDLSYIVEAQFARGSNPFPDWPHCRDEVQEWWRGWRANLTVEFAATIERLRS